MQNNMLDENAPIWIVYEHDYSHSTPPAEGVSAVEYGRKNADIWKIEDDHGHILYKRDYSPTISSLEIDDGMFILRTEEGTSINIAVDAVTLYNAKKKLPARRVLVSHDLIMQALAEYVP